MASEQVGDSTQKDGYSLELFSSLELPERFICILCKKVLRDAVRCPLSLGTRACLNCYNNSIRYVGANEFNFVSAPLEPHLTKLVFLIKVITSDKLLNLYTKLKQWWWSFSASFVFRIWHMTFLGFAKIPVFKSFHQELVSSCSWENVTIRKMSKWNF